MWNTLLQRAYHVKTRCILRKQSLNGRYVVDKLEKCFQLRNWLDAASHDLLYFILFSLLA